MPFLQTLVEESRLASGPALPAGLREAYDGDLHFPPPPEPRPYVIGNFVCTLDGVVSFKIEGQSGGAAISGSNEGDRFIMGLLRAAADAVLVGAHTVHDVSPKHLWIPGFIYPEAKALYTEYRVKVLHKPQDPLVVIISGSGRLELERAIFRTQEVRTVVITTAAGQDELAKTGASRLGFEIRTLETASGRIGPAAILELLRSQFGVEVLLHEGGPTLFGQFLAAEVVDELFLTLSPQVAGRAAHTIRPALAQGVEFLPNTAPWFQLLGIKRQAEHLYLRYRRRHIKEGKTPTLESA